MESLKAYFLSRCDRFAVPGKASFEYLQSLGSAAESISIAPNAVDNDRFRLQAESIRGCSSEFCEKLGLPSRFLLYVGRLVPEKGVFDLLGTYAELDPTIRSTVGLVFAGNGQCKAELEWQAQKISPGLVCFPGFLHREDLAGLYALADALILPTHSDPWGLVVNEGMACGLPIIVTSVAGCSADLVEDGWNGYVVPPHDPEELHAAMDLLLRDSHLRQEMSVNSRRRIRAYSPEDCAEGLAAAALGSTSEVQWMTG